ncbi:MAG: hypothetical protein HY521_02585 [Proteobacteria bacterium]|nr:hypothetical protein [Pseudomonadota bacterium]
MGEDLLRYDVMVEAALRGVIRDALAQAAKHGLSGGHHFYITFRTGHPGVRIPEHLTARFPEEMTIVLQHQFWDLRVSEDGFEVGLSFNRVPERLAVPFAAVTAFADPEVKFGLKFQVAAAAGAETAETPEPAAQPAAAASAAAAAAGEASVVSLEAFRRKPSSGKGA